VAWKEGKRGEFGSAAGSSAARFRKKKGRTLATRGFIHATEYALWMRTPERGTAASSCVARRVATLDAATLLRRQSTPLLEHCSKLLSKQFWGFAKFAQNLNWSQNSTKTKVVQNFICYKTCFGDQS
jgi:hypothetical protein